MVVNLELKKNSNGLWVSTCGKIFTEFEQKKRGRYFYINYKGKKIDVHRIVAQTYLDNPDKKPWVLHFDDNPENNNISNLRWGTALENSADAIRNHVEKLHPGLAKKIDHKFYKDILKSFELGMSQIELAKIWNVCPSRISQIITYMKNRRSAFNKVYNPGSRILKIHPKDYERVAEDIKSMAGVKYLAEKYNVSPQRIIQVTQLLKKKGLLERKRYG